MPKISLKAARVNARLTLIEAARLLGIGKDRLIKWEKHSGLVPPVWQQKISAVYKMPLDMIYFG
ncbi:helix-turn-helix domain-containing protein [Acidaminococcus timonensis]|uniref:helix-turn-helix domain-containing protein n=1 Tax=Acidaminococcus TaxID=904 RepID=UPI0026EE4878|nr:helix-turn-helix transcriptional regulator [Acidaminococcus timonensis]